ncbi:hypothetical protein DCE79_11265 [Lysinibacillus sp. 2017]|uniref:hypothetical protein n=1 Tax=unclassified Lysinibacillus TaxID=2636778 RepID=UPI000D52614B|nr:MULTISPECIES: hypothetical protein [unclassified Lysinibacillus]AWE07930.1 hypothetical protein DCE79_11265 [Lysinibacillus sp. 2017]TGN31604.1 hypothetical protein E4L99_16695 [Lysinibacillus sp. S2017]
MSLYRYFASKKPLPTVTTLEKYHFGEQFEVLPCRKSPPIAAGGQIQKPNIYKVRGNTNETFLNQLVDYIKGNVEEQNRVEFWSIWHSEKVPFKNIHRINPQQVTIEDLRFLNEHKNSCIKFFPKNNK